MKKMKFATLLVALISLFSLSSCLSESSNDGYDVYAEVSLKPGSLGQYYLITDAGIIFYPENSTVLSSIQFKDGSYLERFVGAFKLSEGEVFDAYKNTYKVSEIAVNSTVPYKSMTTQPDTIKADHGIYDIHNNVWATNGYVNVPIYYYYSSASQVSVNDFNLYATGASQDTLFVTLKQSRAIDSSEYPVTTPQVISFSMPFNNYDFYTIYNEVQPKNDTLVIKISAKSYDNSETIVKTTKYKASQR